MNFITTSSIGAAALSWAIVLVSGSELVIKSSIPAPIEGGGIAPESVKPGHAVIVDWKIIKRTDCKGQNSRVWNGMNGFHMTEGFQPTTLPTSGNWREYHVETLIPQLAPSGNLSLSIVGFYQCPGSAKQEFELGPVVMKVVR